MGGGADGTPLGTFPDGGGHEGSPRGSVANRRVLSMCPCRCHLHSLHRLGLLVDRASENAG